MRKFLYRTPPGRRGAKSTPKRHSSFARLKGRKLPRAERECDTAARYPANSTCIRAALLMLPSSVRIHSLSAIQSFGVILWAQAVLTVLATASFLHQRGHFLLPASGNHLSLSPISSRGVIKGAKSPPCRSSISLLLALSFPRSSSGKKERTALPRRRRRLSLKKTAPKLPSFLNSEA